jgi:S-adenosylmethionine:tRNA ribosyltransferase-isomerase
LESAAAHSAGPLAAWSGETDLFIYPPYAFKMVDAMVTNFHLPRTSLLLLVGALAGEELLRRAYQQAVAYRYRFYSYGDAMLVL